MGDELFVAQGDHGVNAHRPPRRNMARDCAGRGRPFHSSAQAAVGPYKGKMRAG